MLTGSIAGHAANTISLEVKTLARQVRALNAIFTSFLTAANTFRQRTQKAAYWLFPPP